MIGGSSSFTTSYIVITTLPSPININHPKNKRHFKLSHSYHRFLLSLTHIIVGKTKLNWIAMRPPRMLITYLIFGKIIAIKQDTAKTIPEKVTFSFWLNSSLPIIYVKSACLKGLKITGVAMATQNMFAKTAIVDS